MGNITERKDFLKIIFFFFGKEKNSGGKYGF